MATSPLTSPPIAKAALYYFPKSIWSAVALLAVEEKGYGPDEIDRKIVDLNKSENCTISYLRVNPKGTVPCLVVPLEKTLAAGIDNKYKALTESTTVTEFLDKSRSSTSKTNTTSSAPAPSLSPATVASSSTSNNIIKLIHVPEVAPLKFMASARNLEELRQRADAPVANTVRSRLNSLRAVMAAESEPSAKVRDVWKAKVARLEPMVELFDAAGKEDSELTESEKVARQMHYEKSDALWSVELRKVLTTLEKEIVGPLCLGDQVSLADLHLAAYVTRLVVVTGGTATKDGVDAIPLFATATSGDVAGGQWTIGPKIKTFWETMRERASWKAIYGNAMF